MMLQHKSHAPTGYTHMRKNSFSTSPHAKRRTNATLKRTSILSVKKKSEWPELVGLHGLEARQRIKQEIPDVQAPIVSLYEDMITEEYMPGRVQIFVDEHYLVTWPPQIG